MATRQMLINQLMGLRLYLRRKLSLRRERDAASVYLAYGIGPDVLVVTVYELTAQSDKDALQEATPLFHEGLKRVEVWCDSRKVGDIPPRADEISDEAPVRDSA
jgi:hypothetical protein